MRRSILGLVMMGLAPGLAAAQDVGIPECDSFLKHYGQCIETGATPETKTMMRDAVAQMRAQYRDLKSQMTPEQVKDICVGGRAALQQTFAALKCQP